ncbi:MAG: tetratricopeptide repeat protein, partial [Flavobacteriales bacterium]|nr:tetratricopeptide repeat protein [Flavobacteriales bacterium]
MKRALETTQHMVNRSLKSVLFFFFAIAMGFAVGCSSGKQVQDSQAGSTSQVAAAFFEAQRLKALGDDTKAYEAFARVIELDPQNDAAYFEQAKIEFDRQAVTVALDKINKAIEIDPENKWYRQTRGKYSMEVGDYAGASEDFEFLVEGGSKATQDHYDLINSYIYQEDYKKAIDAFTFMENTIGHSEETSVQKLDLIRKTVGLDAELEELDMLITLYPKQGKWYARKAKVLKSLGRDEESLEILEKSSDLSGVSGEVHLQLAQWRASKGKDADAMSSLKDGLQDPQLDVNQKLNTMAEMESFLLSRSKEEILDLFGTLESMNPKDAGVFILKGDLLLDMDAKDEAFASYRKSVELDPGQLEVWGWLLDSYIAEKEWEEGLITANEALELYPSYPTIYLQKAYLHMGMDQYTEAIAALKMGEVLVIDDPFLQAPINGEL